MIPLREALLLCAIVDPEVSDYDLPELVTRLTNSGVRYIQYRDKKNNDRLRFENARQMNAICLAAGAYFFINDRVDIALLVGAKGVHLGPQDLPLSVVKRLSPGLLIGASAGDATRAAMLEKEGADYLGVGAIFDAKATKPNASQPKGVAVIEKVSKTVQIPFVGIGGITQENARQVINAGAAGVAMARALTQTKNIEQNTGDYFACLKGN